MFFCYHYAIKVIFLEKRFTRYPGIGSKGACRRVAMATENKQSRGLAPKMGFWNSFLTWLKIKKKEANILIVGLDNSGKSTIVQYFQSPGAKRTETVPTIGFRVDKIKSKFLQLCPQKIHRLVTFVPIDDGLTLTAFDMSGQSKYRSLWEVKFCYGFGV